MLRGPALALAAQPPAQGAVAEHACDARGQRAWIALGDEQPRHAVAHRALQTAHPGGNDGAAAGHRLQRHHPERLVVRGQHRDVGGDVPVAQALLRLRADEADGVAEAERGGAAADVGLVPIGRLVGLAADHGKVRGRAGAAQTADGVEQRLEPFDRRDAADVEQERPGVEPERGAGGRRIAGREQVGVHTARDHGHARRVGAVGGDEPVALDGVGGHQPVGGGDDAPLLGDAQGRLALGGDAGAVLEGAERVEHLHQRHPPARAQRQSHHAGEPVVAVQEVVLDAVGEAPRLDAVHEFLEVGVDALARHRRLRPRRQVDHARAVGQTHHARDGGVLRAREHVHGRAHARQLARELAHVDVHAARLLAAERGERARVHAEHRDPEAHAGGPITTR